MGTIVACFNCSDKCIWYYDIKGAVDEGVVRVVVYKSMQLHIKKLHPEAKMPQFAHASDAGLDLFAVEDVIIAPGERVSIPTGIAMQVPFGYVGLIWDKSGLAHKGGLKTLGGVIDAGYRGEIFVGLLNTSAESYKFTTGQKIAQLLIQKVEHPEIIEVTDLDATQRGEGRFGSTGA